MTVGFPYPGKTGTPLHAMEIVRNLRKKEIEVFVVQFRDPRNRKIKKDSFEGIAIWRVPFPLWHVFLSYLLRRKKADIIHAQHVSAAVTSFMPAKFLKIPFVYEAHSFWIAEIEMLGVKKSPLFYYTKITENYVLKHCEAVIALSEKMKEEFIKKGVDERRMHLIYPSVDLRMFNARKAENMPIEDCLPEDLIVMYTGNFWQWQGIDLLLDSIPSVTREVSNVKFVIVGGKPEEIRIKQNKVKKVRGHVIFLGRQPYNLMPSLMSKADVLVIPRPNSPINWTTPRKMGEYLAMGKPVLATDVGDHKRILIDNKCGIVTPPSSEMFAKELITLLEDDTLRLSLGKNTRKTAMKLFDMDTSMNKLIKVYEDLQNGT